MTTPRSGLVSETPTHSHDSKSLTQHLSQLASGQHSALLHLELSRARQIARRHGVEGARALTHQMLDVLPIRHCDERADALMLSDAYAVTLLLEDCSPENALRAARRIRQAVDHRTFSWQGHPFRLGAHVGVIELDGTPETSLRRCLAQARRACSAAQEMGGTGETLVRSSDAAWIDVQREREWREHLTQVIA